MRRKYICIVGYVTDLEGKKIYHLMEDPTPKTRTAAKAMLKRMAKKAKAKGAIDLMVASEEHFSTAERKPIDWANASDAVFEEEHDDFFNPPQAVRKFEYLLMKQTKGKPGKGVMQTKPVWKPKRVPKPDPLDPSLLFIAILATCGPSETTTILK